MLRQLISPKAVCQECAISRATLDRMVNAGTFPAPVRISERRLAFEKSRVADWITEKLEAA